jgi:uncharacterized protein (TIGR02266 family)
MSDGQERRTARRFAARIKVNFRSVEELVTAYTGDVSRGGLFVTAAQQLPPGTDVQLAMEVPDGGPPALVPARVAYTLGVEEAQAQGKQPGMGMQFLESDVASLAERIATFLASSVDAEVVEPAEPLHVLVVDDSRGYRFAVERAMTAAGHRVTTAEHGLEALGKALKDPPDVILTDVTMPVMDGWQLLRLVRARDATRAIPVAFMSSLDSDADRIKGYELGVDDYIGKPIAPSALVLRVQRIVARGQREAGAGADQGMSGDLRQVALPSLLAFAEAERRTGLLSIVGPLGEASIGLSGGAVISVELPKPSPPSLFERLIAVLDWTEGRFVLRSAELVAGDEAVTVQQALLEHARRTDEAGS